MYSFKSLSLRLIFEDGDSAYECLGLELLYFICRGIYFDSTIEAMFNVIYVFSKVNADLFIYFVINTSGNTHQHNNQFRFHNKNPTLLEKSNKNHSSLLKIHLTKSHPNHQNSEEVPKLDGRSCGHGARVIEESVEETSSKPSRNVGTRSPSLVLHLFRFVSSCSVSSDLLSRVGAH
jgi:hypothetical protein